MDMRYEICDLSVRELASKRRHLPLAIFNDGDQIGVRLFQDVRRVERTCFHGLTGRRVTAAIGSVAHLALRNIDFSGALGETRHTPSQYEKANDSVTDKMFQHG